MRLPSASERAEVEGPPLIRILWPAGVWISTASAEPALMKVICSLPSGAAPVSRQVSKVQMKRDSQNETEGEKAEPLPERVIELLQA